MPAPAGEISVPRFRVVIGPHRGAGQRRAHPVLACVLLLVAATATAFPDYVFSAPRPLALALDRLTAYAPWRMTATNLGPFEPPGFAPTGRAVDLYGIDVWQFRNGLVWRYQAVYNYSVIARQLGLAPPRGGTIERLAVHAQRALAKLRTR